ncbi:MAG: DUF1566 domain-containing protein [Prevotella sp.]|jgi:uncharacterized protein (TIGR02145 family)|nr:DUF1566 domain-containing protein [Prevotella sp.]
MKQIKLNNLIWDDKNIILNDKKLLNWEVAMKAGKDGWRLPTIDELKALANFGSTWDSVLKGRWFGPDSELLSNSKQSVFLPADGFRDPDGSLHDVGKGGYYWSASPYNSSNAYYLVFYSGYANPGGYADRKYGFSVRLVKDANEIVKQASSTTARYRLKKEAVQFFKKELATVVDTMNFWKSKNVDEAALEKAEAYIIYGNGETRNNLCGFDSKNGVHFNFQVKYPVMNYREYTKFRSGESVRELMNRLQDVVDRFYLESRNNG